MYKRTQRDRVPVPEPNVGAALVSNIVRVQEELEFRLGRQTAPLRLGIRRQIVVRSKHRPLCGDFDRNRSINCSDLKRVSKHASSGNREYRALISPSSSTQLLGSSALPALQNDKNSLFVTGLHAALNLPTSTWRAGLSLSHPYSLPSASCSRFGRKSSASESS
jgi:hypothetical protein